MKPDTYVACAMTAMPKDEYEILRHSILAVCEALRARGLTPYSEPYEEGLEHIDTPLEAIKKNREVLNSAKQFVLIYTHKESSSALIELGYVWSRGIPITVFVKDGVKVPYYLRDAEAAEKHGMRIYTFDVVENIPKQLKNVSL